MYITKVVYQEIDETPDYEQLEDLGVIQYTDYGTIEVCSDSIENGFEEFEGSEEEYNELLESNFGSDVMSAINNGEVDIIMVV